MARAPSATHDKDLPSKIVELVEAKLTEHAQRERFFLRAALEPYKALLPRETVRPPLAHEGARRPASPEALMPPPPPPPSSKGKGVGKRTKVSQPSTSSAAPSYAATVSVAPPRAMPQEVSSQRAGQPGAAATRAAPQKAATQGPRSHRARSSAQEEDPLLPSTTPSNDGWKTVQRKKKSKASTAAATPGQERANKRGKPASASGPPPSTAQARKSVAPTPKKKLVAPRSAVVLVKLTPAAIEGGATYDKVLGGARQALGNEAASGSRFRVTRTGARLFEFPGTQSGPKADDFANKLRHVVAESVQVVRPVKTTTLLVSELDDSVTKEEVAEQAAAVGGCGVADVKVGDVWPSRRGLGCIRVCLPTVAAKKIVEGGRLKVGWTSAAVKALEDEPLRCYRCFSTGHTRENCPSKVDRSELCFRCGKEGHKAKACTAEKVSCAVCAASGRPADHRMRGNKCRPPQKNGTRTGTALPAAVVADAPSAAPMEVVEGVPSTSCQ